MTDRELAEEWCKENMDICKAECGFGEAPYFSDEERCIAKSAFIDGFNADRWHYPSKGEYPPIGEHRVASDLVLIFCDDKGFMVYHLDRYNVYNEWEKYPHNPTAWMPLPKPPKEEE